MSLNVYANFLRRLVQFGARKCSVMTVGERAKKAPSRLGDVRMSVMCVFG